MLPLKKSNHLTSLQATLPILNADTIGYALNKFPKITSLILVRSERRLARSIRLCDIPKTLLNEIMKLDSFELKNLNLSNYSPILDALLKERTNVKEITLAPYSGEYYGKFKLQVDITKYMKDGTNVTSICAKSNQSDYRRNLASFPEIGISYEMKLLEEYGAFIETLIIHNLLTYGAERNGFILNSLIPKCPYLKTLIFAGVESGMSNAKEEPPCTQNFSVETLILNQKRISASMYKLLSRQLQALSKVIVIVNMNLPLHSAYLSGTYDFDQYLHRKKAIWIDMPHSQLDCIHLQYKMNLEVHQNRLMFIRLQEDDKIRYFYCLEKFTPRTKALFNECTEKVLGDCLSKSWY